MKIPEAFNPIRPFEPEDLPAVYDRLLADPQFQAVVKYLFPEVPFEALAQKMRACKTSLDFQKTFCYGILERLLAHASKGCDLDASAVDVTRRYTFVSNHRDIVLDSALLDKLLLDVGFTTTCEIAIGDNLLSLPWVKDLVRLNKSFIVRRGLPLREMIANSRLLSDYMHFAISEKHENIWIAQRQGRAKDSDDRTAEGVLKMMSMGGEGTVQQRLEQLHLVPLAISYEYDPCDFLKAAELQQRRDDPNWKKGPADDLVSMKTGIMGYKGHIHYQCAPCMDDYLRSIPADTPRGELLRVIGEHIDEEIFRRYRLYPGNYVALDELEGNKAHEDHYTEEEKQTFDQYIDKQLAKIQIPNPDTDFLRRMMLTMYANPARNQLNTLKKS